MQKKIYELRKSFYDSSLLETFIMNLEKVVKNIGKIETMTQTMIKEGYAKNIDLLEVKSKKTSVERLLLQSKSNYTLNLQFISFLVNQEVRSLDVSSLAVLDHKHLNIDVGQLIMVKKAHEGVEISKQMIHLQVADFLPTVGAFVEYGSSDETLFGNFESHDSYTVGLQVKMNLFNGLQTMANLEKAKLGVMKAQMQLQIAQKGLGLKVQQLVSEVSSLSEELKSLNTQLRLEEAIVANVHNRYAEKLLSISQVMIAESEHLKKVLEFQKISNQRNEKILYLTMLKQGNK